MKKTERWEYDCMGQLFKNMKEDGARIERYIMIVEARLWLKNNF